MAPPSETYSPAALHYRSGFVHQTVSNMGTNGCTKTNGHAHAKNGTNAMNGSKGGTEPKHQNGTARSECWIPSTGLEKWKLETESISERCDMSGLTREPIKYQLASTGMDGEALSRKERTVVVTDGIIRKVTTTCSKQQISRELLLLLATHQMLKGFGNGTHTITASFTKQQDASSGNCYWKVVPTIMGHVGRNKKYMSTAIAEMKKLAQSDNEDLTSIAPGELVRAELLDLIVLFDDEFNVAPLPDFPLMLGVRFGESEWVLKMRYAERLFDTMVVDSFLGALRKVLEVATEPTQLLGELELLPQEQLAQMEAWNNTDGDYPSQKRLHHLVEEAATRCPDKIAIICGDKRISYRELNAQANRLANYICSLGIGVEQLVGLFLDKSELMIETIIGVWKSGAAHVPIDPAYPNERIQFVLDDVKTRFIIASQTHTHRVQAEIVGNRQIEIIALEPLLSRLSSESLPGSTGNLTHLPLASNQLAYVTYTSGTTGFPKGIFKEHTSVVNSITDLSVRYGVAGNDDEVILLFSAYVFEPFVRQMLMALTTGNKLAIISDEEKFDPNTLLPYIQKHKVTYINGTASVLQEYDFTTCPSLKRMILVGENLTDSRYAALRRRFKARILNEYGFTESAFVTALNVFEPTSKRQDMSLGRPVRNVKCYILDANLKRVPLGVTGELHIGGLGISRGYMNREELTRKKFLPNPYQTAREHKAGLNCLLYKTGDLARWLPNGEVEYLGRIDFQIKLRGIRIEPGEIESTLALYPGVRTSMVVSKKLLSAGQETTQDHLVGYFVCDKKTIPENDLLSFLEKKLPRYMIPTRLVQLPVIPVTINGKADLRALPTVDIAVPSSELAQYRCELDERLADIWGDVLGISSQKIGLEQNFFRLGGHSITCIQLIARVRQSLSVGISLEEVFKTRSLRNMSDLLRPRTQEERGLGGDVQNGTAVVESGMSENSYLANSLQQGFVYHSLKTQQTDAYIMHSTLHYGVSISQDCYRAAWEHVHRQHPALRLRFSWECNVMQVVDARSALDWRVVEASHVRSHEQLQTLLARIGQDDHSEGYRLETASLIRIYFIKLPESCSACIFSCHHSILDGWSLPLLFERLHEAYLCLKNGTQPSLDEDSAYIHAQKYLQAHRDTHLDFWASQVNQIEERCDLNALLNEASRYKVPLADYDQIQEQGQQSIRLPRDAVMNKLLEECSAQGVTLHSILQLVWHLVLHAYGGGSHTVTGTTISGRNLPIEGIERSIGLFINTLPLVLDHTSYQNMTAMDAISQVQSQVNAMNSRGSVELGRLSKDDLKHGLFDTLFVLENYPNLEKSQRDLHEEVLKYKIAGGTEKLSYPLAVIAQEHGNDGCDFTICYARELFNDDTISFLLHTVYDTLQNIAKNPDAPIRDIEYLSADQIKQLDKWNATEDEYPSGTLHSVFETEAQQKPDKVAVIYEDIKLTYRELNGRANALAYCLLEKVPIKPNKLIALVIEKSEHLITNILAVWKSGGAYVPIDASYPDDRIKYILDDTSALAVIADKKYMDRLSKIVQGSTIPVIPSDKALHLPSSSTHPISTCNATDLAYVMYTSGTTGKPKGVMVEHHGIVNLAVSLSKIFGLRDTDDEVILSFSNYVFDHFVEQMTDALLNGQTLLVLNDEMRGDKERLYQYIETNRVTYLSGTPSVISMYEFGRFRDHLRRIDCVGEAFSEPVFDKIRETFSGLVINGYGPTEVSITTHKRLYPFPERRTDKSIGKQVANSTSYVLNDDMKRVPIGAVGELYLGGDGVARGYHNRPDLTAERFPANPFQSEQERREGRNARLYKTGDLVRWIEAADGEVEYLGRNDFQVKIRGQRIELGEIEAILSSYPDIEQSVVLAKDRVSDGQKYLVGYYVSSGSLSPQAIRRYMQSRLPSHMVPARLIPMDKFPVTVSGKLDSKALPVPDETGEDEVVPPRTEIERVLASIWADLLEIPVESISIYSDFFSLGGDSLRSTKLSFAATKALGVSVTVSSLFRYPTIEAFARWIVSGSAETLTVSPLGDESLMSIPISPAQERLLFLHEFDQGGSAYNIAIQVELDVQLCLESFERALRSVLSRHEALRTLLTRSHESSHHYQKILDADDAHKLFQLETLQSSSETQMRRQMSESANKAFRLDCELPFVVCMHQLQTNGCVSLYASFVFHHSAFDAWSWDIFQSDLRAYYALHAGHHNSINLPSLRVQYKEYAVEHHQNLSSDRNQVLSEFWSNKLSGLESLFLVTDRPRPAQFDYQGGDLQLVLGSDLVSEIRALAKRQGASLYTVMLAAYCYLLNVYTMQTDIVIGVPVSHRNRAEYESVIGFFVNLLPFRVDVCESDISKLIASVQKHLVDAQIHMDMPFQEIVKLMNERHDPSRHPLVQAVFNWETEALNKPELSRKSFMQRYDPASLLSSVAKFDLNVTVKERADAGLLVNFNYATSLFEEETIAGFLRSYQTILQEMSDGETDRDSSMLAPTEQWPEKSQFKTTDLIQTDRENSLAELFESQVNVNAHKLAVVEGGSRRISYGDLNERANRLAHWMVTGEGVKSGDHVALMLSKSIEMVISILAVWKAGAAYVPLDPDYPAQRVNFTLQDTGAKLLITTKNCLTNLSCSADTKRLVVDDVEVISNIRNQPHDNLTLPRVDSNVLAYVIFTSGTTGKPKGVMIEHQSVANLQKALSQRYFGDTNGTQSVLLLSNYVFDFSVEQIVLSVLSGNKLIIPPEEGVTHESFYELANSEQLSYLSGTPSVLQQIQLSRLPQLQMVTAAGEEFHSFQYASMRSQFKGPINNAYGITETTVYNLVTTFQDGSAFTKALCDELRGTMVYVLNDRLQRVPINAVGELYLAGDCVARGYLNQESLTNERFIENPFNKSGKFGRMYKTGDLVRYRGPGRLEYLGRRDQQVKLRGFRIELSEVQNALANIPGIKEAAVLPSYSQGIREDSSSRIATELVGYYNLKDGVAIIPSDVRTSLAATLPSFMVPSKLYCLHGPLPVTVNGKLDTRTLAVMNHREQTNTYVAPRNVLEAKLCLLWAAVIGKTHGGIDDDLFTNGGDSISSLQLVGDIHRQLGLKVTVKDIFIHRTVRAVHDNVLVKDSNGRLLPPLNADQGLVAGDAALLPIQDWFLSKELQHPGFWNHCFTIRTPKLDIEKLAQAVTMLQCRHDIVRMRLQKRNSRYVQTFPMDCEPVKIKLLDVTNLENTDDIQEALSGWQSQFNVETGPLFCIAYLHGYQDGSARVWCAFHHLIIDTVSWNIVRSDLQSLYHGVGLGMKSSSFQQWSNAVQDYALSSSERQYWDGIRAEAMETAEIFSHNSHTMIRCEDQLSTNETMLLFQQCCPRLSTGMHEILLVSVGFALQKLMANLTTIVTIEGHGREENVDPSLDVSRTVGWFTSMYPFKIPQVTDLVQGVMNVKRCLDRVPNHGIGYGPSYGYSDDSLPPVTVNYLGRLDQVHGRQDEWVLAAGENELPHGLYTSSEDRDRSSSMLDITFGAINGRLSIQVASRWDSKTTDSLLYMMKTALRELIERVNSQGFELPDVPSREEEFTPFFSFDDESRHGPPLFLLPPGEGGAESYFHNIVKESPNRKLIVFNNHYRHSKSLSTFEELAEYYVTHMRNVQPRGPFHIIGWSFGGILAMEIAQHLARCGERLGTLGLIDPYFDIPRATEAAGYKDEQVLDHIYYMYKPEPDRFRILESSTDHLVLFKAKETDDAHGTAAQKQLYRWYAESSLNRLDTFVNKDIVDLVSLEGSHFSWVHRPDQVRKICSLLEGCCRQETKMNGHLES
ncbi:hypothetical protein QQS21_007073 [Conoideocrella luteorostrata]|uniref:N-(5-amino-5-carboxypentanoyl)-L-cysteinyl-D-valine synthase n=1 Tax=Conoideocrella luteorostrata TaxID=1105319 RepID=A0AAJ0CLE4_9HYPO|nr:hypothetical protein QQS21_007073 [Conoideocrella luteorostrata]